MDISRICGHIDKLYFGTEEAYLREKQNFVHLCLDCRNKFALSRKEVDVADSDALVALELDSSLPQPGNVYKVQGTNGLVQLMRDHSGSYWFRYFPDKEIPYQPWIRDQQEVSLFLKQKDAVLVAKFI